MARDTRTSRARLVGALFVLAATTLTAASCAGLLGIDEHVVAAEALCDTMTVCFGFPGNDDCVGRVERAFSDQSARESFLSSFQANPCDKSCERAMACSQTQPVCGVVDLEGMRNDVVMRLDVDVSVREHSPDCTTPDQCCGFSEGFTSCNLDDASPMAGNCCLRRGLPCDLPTGKDGAPEGHSELCCPGQGECLPVEGTTDVFACGGVVCRQAGVECYDSSQCCTGRCGSDGKCAKEACLPAQSVCDTDLDCCDPVKCVQGVCGGRQEECRTEGLECDAGGDAKCCPGMTCRDRRCQQYECAPTNIDCASSEQCCTHYCDPESFLCTKRPSGGCTGEGAICGGPGECCDGGCDLALGKCRGDCRESGTCEKPEDCCSGTCTKAAGATLGFCQETCSPDAGFRTECPGEDVCFAFEQPDSPDDVPLELAPFAADCADDEGNCDDPAKCPSACVAAVCAADPYCCCIGWDFYCRYKVTTECVPPGASGEDQDEPPPHLCSQN